LVGVGFESELRGFHPHVTLGRIRSRQSAGAFRGLDERLATMTFEEESDVSSLNLFRSRTTRAGTHYSVLSEAPLVAA
jgi:2'-5' RNA ligase